MVEGADDKHVTIHLMARRGYRWDDESVLRPFVRDSDGFDTLLDAVPVALKAHERLGIVVDSDVPEDRRWIRLRDRLRAAGLAVPDFVPDDGLVDAPPDGGGRLRRFGVWLMPDNRSDGTLESFIRTLVPRGDRCWPHAEAATLQAKTFGAPLKQRDHAKGVVHAWLAWQDPPGRPFGTALTAHVLGHDSPEALAFEAWFRRLFE